MDGSSFPIKSILVATAALGIASVATPVRALDTYGLAGSACAAVQQSNFSKWSVPPNGAVSNKSTTATLIVNCPMATKYGYSTYWYVGYKKVDSQVLSCTLHRRYIDYLSGTTNTTSTTFVGSSYLSIGYFNSDWLNSWQCTIPRNSGNGQNNVNGVGWYQ